MILGLRIFRHCGIDERIGRRERVMECSCQLVRTISSTRLVVANLPGFSELTVDEHAGF